MSTASDGFAPDIVTLAVDYHRSPLKYRPLVLPPAEMPDDTGKLLHAACGDGELLAALSRQAGVTPSQLKTAAEFYIRQAFFARDADYYRVLGLRSTDGIERIKEHHRLLMKLFHPDRADTEREWTDALATRVNQAYTVLRKPESRREYDASLRAPQAVVMATGGQQEVIKSRWARMPRPGLGAKIDRLPPSVRRHFPEFVLGGTGMFAALVVGALYLFQERPLTGSGAIGALAISAPANMAGQRSVADATGTFTSASRSPENTLDDASRGVPPVPATADLQGPAAVAPVVVATNESTAATESDAPISIPARPEPVVAKTVAPQAPAKTSEATVSAPPRVADAGQPAIASVPPPLPVKLTPIDAQAQAKANPTTAPPKTETAKPVTVASTSSASTASGIKTSVPEIMPAGKVVPPPAPTPAKTAARAVPEKTALPEVAPRADVIPPPVPARTTAKTTVARAAPAPVVMASAPAVPRTIFPDLELDRLIGRFIGTYEQGDIDRFMVLFHEDAETGEKKHDKATTRKEYASLFTSTQMRRMMLQGFRWEKGDEMVRGQGRFLARVAGQGDPYVRELAGNIRIEVTNVSGVLLIKGLYHNIETKKHVPRGTDGSSAGGR